MTDEAMAHIDYASTEPLHYAFSLHDPLLSHGLKKAESTTACSSMDMFGNCWDVLGKGEAAAPVAFDEAQPSDTNVALSGDCTQDFVDSFVAKQVSDLVANMAARIADPDGGTSGE